MKTAAVVGAGIFGVTAAAELRRRGWRVLLLDPGPIPHPMAASTDISKVIRLAYGSDEAYTGLMEQALEGWRRWNSRWTEPLFHETGVLFLTRAPMATGEFEYESFRVLEKRGHHPVRLTPADLRQRFPAWRAQGYADGFYHAEGGYAESGRVVARLLEEARALGVEIRGGVRFLAPAEEGSRVAGVRTTPDGRIPADRVLIAAGAWTPKLLPEIAPHLRVTAHPVFHFRPPNTRLYTERLFPVFTADITRTGWYGFPLSRDGVVKIANHGPGREFDPDDARGTLPEDEAGLREFLEATFPTLAPLPIAGRHVCLYCDTRDEHFWIDSHPDRRGLAVATGDSGHAFKFAPVLGEILADVVEERPTRWGERFRWRKDDTAARGQEEARRHT
jgi:glycine/D-amino acid oxidase-like deaminating enzyme